MLLQRNLAAYCLTSIAFLTHPHERDLTMAQSQMAPGYAAAQIAALTTSEISALGSTQITSFTTAQIPALTPTEISALSTTQMGYFTSTQIPHFTAAQLAAMSTAQFNAL